MSVEVQDPSVTQYRTISPMAILALLVALASPLALILPLLAVIALAAIFLAVYALRQIAASPELLSGRGFALAALMVGVFVLGFLPTRMYTRHQVLAGYATNLSDAFMELMQAGKIREAHALSNLRFPAYDPSKPPGKPGDKLTDDDFRGFMKLKAIEKLVALNREYTYRLEGLDPSPGEPHFDVLVLRYLAVPQAGRKEQPFSIWITTDRSLDEKTKLPKWRIRSISEVRASN